MSRASLLATGFSLFLVLVPATHAQSDEAKAVTANQQLLLHTDKPVLSIAAIPATAHRGLSHVVVAHGADGVSIYDTNGKEVQHIDTQADLVAYYQNQLVVYQRKGDTTLDHYVLNLPGSIRLTNSQSPSPIAATTLQRTAFASLGPLRIKANELELTDQTLSFAHPVQAVASVTYFPPLVASDAIIVGLDQGDILIRSLN